MAFPTYMEKTFKRTTVTSTLPYANGPVHIGHLAGVYVPADIYVRYLRLKKQEVLFIGGSDEHGVPITIRAKKEGCTPQDIVDRYHALIRDSQSADYVLAVYEGIVRAVFKPHKWYAVEEPKLFAGTRYAFEGEEVLNSPYLNKDVSEYVQGQSPVRYINF